MFGFSPRSTEISVVLYGGSSTSLPSLSFVKRGSSVSTSTRLIPSTTPLTRSPCPGGNCTSSAAAACRSCAARGTDPAPLSYSPDRCPCPGSSDCCSPSRLRGWTGSAPAASRSSLQFLDPSCFPPAPAFPQVKPYLSSTVFFSMLFTISMPSSS